MLALLIDTVGRDMVPVGLLILFSIGGAVFTWRMQLQVIMQFITVYIACDSSGLDHEKGRRLAV